MRVIIVSGFLGSGKTTFTIKLLKYLNSKNLKVALIVNELGEIGIDNQYMKQLGYNVWELFGGCICCTLATNLEETYSELEKNYKPDYILIEPSGAAEPKAIYDSFVNLGIDRNNIHNFMILDSTRIDMFMEILSPLLHSSLQMADTVIVNKIDLLREEEINRAIDLILPLKTDLNFYKLNLNKEFTTEFNDYIDELFLR